MQWLTSPLFLLLPDCFNGSSWVAYKYRTASVISWWVPEWHSPDQWQFRYGFQHQDAWYRCSKMPSVVLLVLGECQQLRWTASAFLPTFGGFQLKADKRPADSSVDKYEFAYSKQSARCFGSYDGTTEKAPFLFNAGYRLHHHRSGLQHWCEVLGLAWSHVPGPSWWRRSGYGCLVADFVRVGAEVHAGTTRRKSFTDTRQVWSPSILGRWCQTHRRQPRHRSAKFVITQREPYPIMHRSACTYHPEKVSLSDIYCSGARATAGTSAGPCHHLQIGYCI